MEAARTIQALAAGLFGLLLGYTLIVSRNSPHLVDSVFGGATSFASTFTQNVH